MIWPTWGSCTHSVSLFQNVMYCSVVYLAVLLVFFCLFACLLWKLGNTNSQQNGLLAVWAVLKMSLLIIDFSWAAAHALLCDSIILNSQLAVCLALRARGADWKSEQVPLAEPHIAHHGLVLLQCWAAWGTSVWAALQKFCCPGSSRYSFQHTHNGVNAFLPSQAMLALEWDGIHCSSKSPFIHLGSFWHKNAVDLSLHPRIVQ